MTGMKHGVSVLLAAALVAAPLAAQQGKPVAGGPEARPADAGYVLGPNDEVEVTFFGQNDLSRKTRIRADGTILLALIGTITAQGKTTATLSKEIANAYEQGGYLNKPSVNVEVTTYNSSTATVLGSVPNAGNYALDRPYTVASMVAQAGGVREGGADAVILTRAGSRTTERISLRDPSGGATQPVRPGDTLFVPVAENVYVYGQVNTPGAYKFEPGMTFRQAMARAGGPTLAASTKKIEVRRKDVKLKDLKLDDQVQPEDVLVIKEKLF